MPGLVLRLVEFDNTSEFDGPSEAEAVTALAFGVGYRDDAVKVSATKAAVVNVPRLPKDWWPGYRWMLVIWIGWVPAEGLASGWFGTYRVRARYPEGYLSLLPLVLKLSPWMHVLFSLLGCRWLEL